MKKQIITLSLIGIVTITFNGCGISSTGPMIAGNHAFKITHQEGIFPTKSGVDMLQSASKEATEFCIKKNKKVNILATDANLGPYVLGKFPVGSITFKCSNQREQSKNILLPVSTPEW
jgi:hypothetical protein